MLIAAVCMKNFRGHFRRCGLLKLNSFLYWDSCLKNIISTSAFPICYPLHTVSQLQDPLPYELPKSSPEWDSTFPPRNFVVVNESCLYEENKRSDNSLINYVTVMDTRDLWKSDIHCDDLLLRGDFRNVLCQSCFHYDVSVVNHRAIEYLLSATAAQGPLIMSKEFYYGLENDSSNSALLLSDGDSSSKEGLSKKNNKFGTSLPTEKQLLNVISKLCYSLLHFFKEPHDFSIYHKNIVFQNNIRGVTTRGIGPYSQQMYLMKVFGCVHYAQVKVELIKITHHIEDGTVRVRWRVSGATRRRVLALLWKYKDSRWKKIVKEDPEWLDGFSVFSVGPDGLIYKHVCDKMIPDEERSTKQNSLRSRLFKLLGLSPPAPAVGGLSAMLAMSPLGQNSDIVAPSPKTK